IELLLDDLERFLVLAVPLEPARDARIFALDELLGARVPFFFDEAAVCRPLGDDDDPRCHASRSSSLLSASSVFASGMAPLRQAASAAVSGTATTAPPCSSGDPSSGGSARAAGS